ncbi:MAG TPA: GIY-YIG nuclease family protein [Candidatus Lumbricidophila sp.]|nr:GIY-YIG nuclease family protein [Candidatus Lumbricidophila sp.]
MSYERRAEAEEVLETEASRLGDTFRGDRQGLSLEQQAERAGANGGNYGYNNRVTIAALIEGVIPSGPTLALQAARRVRTLLKRTDLSAELRKDWVELEQQLTARAEDRSAVEAEDAASVRATLDAESRGVPGIYVYTLPHYLKYPVDPDTGKTYLKVGHSARDAVHRAGAQGRFTALPEDPILLRIYPTEQSGEVERRFHEWLRMADHHGARTRRGGTEWFLTSTKFVDHVARELGLEQRNVNDLDVGDD